MSNHLGLKQAVAKFEWFVVALFAVALFVAVVIRPTCGTAGSHWHGPVHVQPADR
ncbi:MAG TPA: hypothetical protein VMI31_13600 [Fimbriimonadaceae bacterium]|nr:hypothetical protein [Fimbriimonadaceae bacterium]